jgi:exopolysaccharide biosynthesis polyprenyl glycosylphosphotransferase
VDAPSRLLRREARYRQCLLGADLLAGFIAFAVVLDLAGGDAQRLLVSLVALPVLAILAKVQGLYDRDDLLVRKTTIDEIPRLFQHATLATLLLLVLDGSVGLGQTGDGRAIVLWGLLLGLTTAARMAARKLAGTITAAERILVLGDESAALGLRERTAGRLQVEIVGAAPIARMNRHDDLRALIDAFDVDRIIIAPSAQTPGHYTPRLVRAAKAEGVRVSVLPGLLDVVGSQVALDDVFGVTLLGIRRFGLTRSSRAVKRAFDVGAALALALVAFPVFIICAILVKLDSRGPVLFRQERIGLRGRRFRMVKLRTMVQGAEDMQAELVELNEGGDGLFKIAGDPRVTRVGRVLRATHLDELPQLWNVMRGEMSIVGPRPLVPDEDQRVTGLDRRRLELTPGMTGPWQILGSQRRRISMAEMVKLDYLYAANWSLWNDIRILLRTVLTVARRRGV